MPPKSTQPKRKPDEHIHDVGGKMHFVGPAQKCFGSFVELARFTLDTYLAKWIDPLEPISFMSPPIFSFKNPHKSDLVIDKEKEILKNSKQHSCASQVELSMLERPITDRWSDDGEFVVFQALSKLIQDNVQAPFLAVRGLDLGKLKVYLQQIFPYTPNDLQVKFKEMMREYDFVLIGPKIGVILIEVKSTAFTKARDFSLKNRNLPEQIVDGVKQLTSFNLEFLHDCAGIDVSPVVPLRKILVTPNLERSRQQTWANNLDQVTQDKVHKSFNGIIHWFKDDTANVGYDSLKPALYSSLRQILEADGFQTSIDVYELYGPIVVGLGSAWVIKTRQTMELMENHLSTSIAILGGAATLESQDPGKVLHSHSSDGKRLKFDVDENAKLTLSSKMVLLTPDQRKALNGQNYQFIIGAAGTGKTIILQAKAVELLSKGKSVLVFATRGFCQRYQKLFNDHGFEKYEIIRMSDLARDICLQLSHVDDFMSVLNDFEKPATKIFDHLISLSDTSAIQDLLNDIISISKFDAVFIDDAIDQAGQWSIHGDDNSMVSCALLAAIVVGKLRYGSKLLWIALDPFLSPEKSTFSRRRIFTA